MSEDTNELANQSEDIDTKQVLPNSRITVPCYGDEAEFIDQVSKKFGIEKTNLVRRALIKYFKEELGIEVPGGLLKDRSKGNHNPAPPELIGSRWKGHIPKKQKNK